MDVVARIKRSFQTFVYYFLFLNFVRLLAIYFGDEEEDNYITDVENDNYREEEDVIEESGSEGMVNAVEIRPEISEESLEESKSIDSKDNEIYEEPSV